MKETPIFEEVFTRLTRQPGFLLKILVGGLLSFVPVLNFFAFGYLYRFSKNTRNTGQIALPVWDDWKGLFFDGLRFAVVWISYWILPIGVASLLTILLGMVGLGAVAWMVFFATLLVASFLFTSALYRFQMRSDFKDLLDVPLICRMTYLGLPRFFVPALTLLGVFVLILPLYGFAVFVGFLLLIAYSGLCFRDLEQGRPFPT